MRVRHRLLGFGPCSETFNRRVDLLISSLRGEGELLDQRGHLRLFWTMSLLLQGLLSLLGCHLNQIRMNALVDHLSVFARWLQSANRATSDLNADAGQFLSLHELLLSLLNHDLRLDSFIHQSELFVRLICCISNLLLIDHLHLGLGNSLCLFSESLLLLMRRNFCVFNI